MLSKLMMFGGMMIAGILVGCQSGSNSSAMPKEAVPAKVEVKMEAKPVEKAEVKMEAPKAESKPVTKVEVKPEAPKAESKPVAKAEVKPAPQAEVKVEVKPVEVFRTLMFCPKPELLVKQDNNFPFLFFWRRDYVEMRKFTKIMFKPLEKKFWLNERLCAQLPKDEAADWKKDANDMMEDFNRDMTQVFEAVGKKVGLTLTDKADAKTLVVEVALVPMISPLNFRRCVDYSTQDELKAKMLPYGMVCAGLVAIEAVVKDGGNDNLISQIAERSSDIKAFSEGKYPAWQAGARGIFKAWGNELAGIIKAELSRDREGKYISASGKAKTNRPFRFILPKKVN